MKVVCYGKEYEVDIVTSTYQSNDNLAICLLEEGFPFATITVNLDEKLAPDFAFVDVNNCPWAEDFIKDNKLGHCAGVWKGSGYCKYPLYKFNLKEIEKYAGSR